MIDSAPHEIRMTRLADAVALASQQMRVLQERVEPRLTAQIGLAARTLEEREREEHLRLKHLQRSRGTHD
jgi:vacuolar-type H+-ATPase subunit D/Vma8